jgi:hypothetical protein
MRRQEEEGTGYNEEPKRSEVRKENFRTKKDGAMNKTRRGHTGQN